MTSPELPGLAEEDLDRVDFLDLGASRGGSLGFCARRFGGTGIGIDVDPRKVAAAREAGFDVRLADARHLGVTDRVRYVAAMDFLEHLPDLDTTRDVLRAAIEAASEFVFIRHPSFENEHYLRHLGLCQYWHEWHGHPNHLRVADYCELFAELGVQRYAISYLGRVDRTSHETIVPVGFRDRHAYDPEVHGPKPDLALEEPVWRMQELYLDVGGLPPEAWAEVVGSRAGR